MSATQTEQIVTTLTAGDSPRVWSLLVTIFGDLAQRKDAQLSGAALGHITEAMGVRPEALRVAIHRLRKDGWLESHRHGRESRHALTDWGLAQSAAASPMIYGAASVSSTAWLIVHDRMHFSSDMTIVPASPTVCLADSPADPALALSTPLDPDVDIPEWIRDKVAPDAMLGHAQDFLARLSDCEALLRDTPDLRDLDVAILRVLLVHGWRRIALKAPNLPDHVFPRDWQGPACRAKVAALLNAYPRVDLTAL